MCGSFRIPIFNKSSGPSRGTTNPSGIGWTGQEEVEEAIRRIVDLALYLVPRYGQELKSHLTIAIGCTGGRHRSVFVADRVAKALKEAGSETVLRHRDKEQWRYS